MKKALYIHGLASGAKSKSGRLLKQYLTDYEWTLAEVDHHCEDSLSRLAETIETLQPDLVCGTSLGGFYTLCLADKIKGRMVLFNPVLNGREDIRQFVGEVRYFCKRQNGDKTFVLTDKDCDNMRSPQYVESQIITNRERIYVFYSDHDEVLGFDSCKNYITHFGNNAERTSLMGHSLSEDFIKHRLTEYIVK